MMSKQLVWFFLVSMSLFPAKVFSWSGSDAIIKVRVPDSMTLDTLKLCFWRNAIAVDYTPNLPPEIVLSASIGRSGRFRFRIRGMSHPGYITIYRVKSGIGRAFIQYYLLEPGDSVDVRIDTGEFNNDKIVGRGVFGEYAYINANSNYLLSFSGRGGSKFTCRYTADRMHARELTHIHVLGSDQKFNFQEHDNVTLDESLSLLKSMRAKMSDLAYSLLEADFRGIGYSRIIGDLQNAVAKLPWVECEHIIQELPVDIRNVVLDGDYFKRYSSVVSSTSCRFPALVYQRALITSMVTEQWSTEADSDRYRQVVSAIENSTSGDLRLKTLVLYLKLFSNRTNIIRPVLERGDISLVGGYWQMKLADILDAASVGKPGFDFMLSNSDGKIVRLDDLKGRLTFIDFWFTGCYGCKQFYEQSLRSVEAYYHDSSRVEFVSICVDRDIEQWKASVQSDLYTSKDVVNLYTRGHGYNDDLIKYYSIRFYPYQMLLDDSGRVRMMDGLRVSADSLKNIISRNLRY